MWDENIAFNEAQVYLTNPAEAFLKFTWTFWKITFEILVIRQKQEKYHFIQLYSFNPTIDWWRSCHVIFCAVAV